MKNKVIFLFWIIEKWNIFDELVLYSCNRYNMFRIVISVNFIINFFDLILLYNDYNLKIIFYDWRF